jgi:hypothetical protein
MKNYNHLIVLLALSTFSCYKEDDYSIANQSPNDVIKSITVDRKTLIGNGNDKTKITVEFPLDAKDALSTTTLKVDKGVFVESGKNEYQALSKAIYENNTVKRTAIATYQSPLSDGIVTLEITVAGLKKTENIVINRNLAERIKVIPNSFVLASDPANELGLTIKLSSAKGKVTTGQKVSLIAVDKFGNKKGKFRIEETSSNDAGDCSFVYSIAPDNNFLGELLFIARTLDSPILADTTIVNVYKK